MGGEGLYHTALLRAEPVGIDMIPDQIPDSKMVPMSIDELTNIDGDAIQEDVINEIPGAETADDGVL